MLSAVFTLLLSYFLGSMIEYCFHHFVGHPSGFLETRIGRLPQVILQPLIQAKAGHGLHHYLTRENYFQKKPKEKDLPYVKNLEKMYESLEDHNRRTNYGMGFSIYSIMSSLILTLPASLTCHLLIKGLTPVWMLYVFPPMFITFSCRYVHPFLHFSSTDIENVRNPFSHFLLTTKVFRYVKRNHLLHHRSKGRFSYNLLPGFEESLACLNIYREQK